MDEFFTATVVYNVSAYGFGELRGIEAIQAAALVLGAGNPVGHHVTNVVIDDVADSGEVRVQSKGVGINVDGTCGRVTYDDVVVRDSEGWRIASRSVTPRRVPLGG
ncbi:hypothetical protein GCM10023318_45450 [Nocardia callitridis]|uniref:SnoaL-like domain-containing protein n=2 Tax=Nocardia callitridis TaxID=648753 RepID=A0ABP9KSL7_9NOCA